MYAHEAQVQLRACQQGAKIIARLPISAVTFRGPAHKPMAALGIIRGWAERPGLLRSVDASSAVRKVRGANLRS